MKHYSMLQCRACHFAVANHSNVMLQHLPQLYAITLINHISGLKEICESDLHV